MTVVERDRPRGLLAAMAGVVALAAFALLWATAEDPDRDGARPSPTSTPSTDATDPRPSGSTTVLTSPAARLDADADLTTSDPLAGWTIGDGSFGPIVLGATVGELEQELPVAIGPAGANPACLAVDVGWPEVAVLALPAAGSTDPRDAVITKVTVRVSDPPTLRPWRTSGDVAPGVAVGSTLEDLFARYDSVVVEPREPGRGRVARQYPDVGAELAFDLTERDVVDAIHAKVVGTPSFVDGCGGG